MKLNENQAYVYRRADYLKGSMLALAIVCFIFVTVIVCTNMEEKHRVGKPLIEITWEEVDKGEGKAMVKTEKVIEDEYWPIASWTAAGGYSVLMMVFWLFFIFAPSTDEMLTKFYLDQLNETDQDKQITLEDLAKKTPSEIMKYLGG